VGYRDLEWGGGVDDSRLAKVRKPPGVLGDRQVTCGWSTPSCREAG